MNLDAVARAQAGAGPAPMHLTEPTHIGDIGAAQLVAIGLRIMVLEPGHPPRWITPTGLTPVNTMRPRPTT